MESCPARAGGRQIPRAASCDVRGFVAYTAGWASERRREGSGTDDWMEDTSSHGEADATGGCALAEGASEGDEESGLSTPPT